ncbi:hypothetical protein GQ600_17093 [Phytophthora cactorum]|nr:hypothetical protein GQ600_17093 [Phytophthora cactorum]
MVDSLQHNSSAMMDVSQQGKHIWASALRQLRAIARRDRARSTTRLYGLSLQVCGESLAEEVQATDLASPPQQLGQKPRP